VPDSNQWLIQFAVVIKARSERTGIHHQFRTKQRKFKIDGPEVEIELSNGQEHVGRFDRKNHEPSKIFT
jgi:hypothetical protein